MWGNLGDSLAGLGDALTQRASAHAKQAHEQGAQQQQQSSSPQGNAPTTMSPPLAIAADKTATASLSSSANNNNNTDTPGSSPTNQQQQQHVPKWASNFASSVSDKQNQQALLGNFRNWTNTVAESTKHIVNEARESLEKEQARIQASAPSLFNKGGPYKRDPSLPLDVEALRDAEVVYVTDRIVTLSHPYMQSTTDGDITPDRKLAAVGHLLQKRHGGRYMVWNLSEVEYDTSVLDDQVLVYKFPGSPSPPLGLLLKLLMAMESWLKADERNVAVIHCLTGRGRTSTVLSAFLCWTGEAGFTDVNLALEYIAKCKRISVQSLTIPSQVRYVSYFANMLDGVRPSQPPLMLKRIIMSEAPKFGKRPANRPGDESGATTEENKSSDDGGGGGEIVFGCAPYLQLFKGGNLVFTTAASVNYAQTKDDLPFCTTSEGPVSFLTESVVQGDVLLRCRHLTKSGQRVSMFRAAFHTGYVPPKVLRLTKAQLDGACGDKRFADDFFLDLIFEPCDEATASKYLNPEKSTDSGEGDDHGEGANEAAERRSMGVSGSNTVSASAYDTMLHRDSRFWDVITKRRQENMKKQAELEKKGGGETTDNKDEVTTVDENTPLSGPTIGRRREFSSKQTPGGGGIANEPGEGAGNTNTKAKTQQDKMSAFSIGEEFGLDSPRQAQPAAETSSKTAPLEVPLSPPPTREKDSLMEALMGLDDDGLEDDEDEDDGEGEVVFAGECDIPVADAAVSEEEPPTLPVLQASDTSAAVISGDDTATETQPAPATTATTPTTVQEVATIANATTSSAEVNDTTPNAVESTEIESSDDKEDTAADITDILSDIEGLDDDLGDLDLGDGADLGDDIDFDDFDDDDADLEDLENFLTKGLS